MVQFSVRETTQTRGLQIRTEPWSWRQVPPIRRRLSVKAKVSTEFLSGTHPPDARPACMDGPYVWPRGHASGFFVGNLEAYEKMRRDALADGHKPGSLQNAARLRGWSDLSALLNRSPSLGSTAHLGPSQRQTPCSTVFNPRPPSYTGCRTRPLTASASLTLSSVLNHVLQPCPRPS